MMSYFMPNNKTQAESCFEKSIAPKNLSLVAIILLCNEHKKQKRRDLDQMI